MAKVCLDLNLTTQLVLDRRTEELTFLQDLDGVGGWVGGWVVLATSLAAWIDNGGWMAKEPALFFFLHRLPPTHPPTHSTYLDGDNEVGVLLTSEVHSTKLPPAELPPNIKVIEGPHTVRVRPQRSR